LDSLNAQNGHWKPAREASLETCFLKNIGYKELGADLIEGRSTMRLGPPENLLRLWNADFVCAKVMTPPVGQSLSMTPM